MSYILEALRKAERERNLGRIPDLETVYAQLPLPRKRRSWLWLLLALVLAGNTIALVMLVPQRKSHQTRSLASPTTGIPQPANSASRTPPGFTLPTPQMASPPTPRHPEPPTAESGLSMPRSPTPQHQSESLADTDAGAAIAAASSAALSSSRPFQQPAQPSLSANVTDAPKVDPAFPPEPSTDPQVLAELSAARQGAIPALNLDIHVYHEIPGRSFVVINSRRYQAGDTLHEGPLLERITANGVVLNQQGQRFLLPVHH